MRFFITMAVVIATLTLGACTKPGFGENPEYLQNNELVDVGININPATDPATSQYFSTSVGDRVLFNVDQYTITLEGKAVLNAQVTWLRQNPHYFATIEGHADEQGTREYNLALGARRANAVQTYLISQGVDRLRLKTLSFGKERPIELCSNEVCYAKNRRSVTVLATGAG